MAFAIASSAPVQCETRPEWHARPDWLPASLRSAFGVGSHRSPVVDDGPATNDDIHFPLLVELIPGRLNARIYVHDLQSMSGAIPCWSFVTEGLSEHGQAEFIFTLRRDTDEVAGAYPVEVLDFFRSVYELAERGRLVGAGDYSELRAGLFRDRLDATGIGYLSVSESLRHELGLPDAPYLAAVLLSAQELEALKEFGPARVIASLAAAQGRYPPYSDRRRPSVISTPLLREHSILGHVVRIRTAGARAVLEENRLSLILKAETREKFTQLLTNLPSGSAFAFLTDSEDAAEQLLLWQPGQKDAVAFDMTGQCASDPGRTLGGYYRSSGSFVAFGVGVDEDRTVVIEDGFGVTLTDESWGKVKEALRLGTPVVIPPTRQPGSAFAIEWTATSYRSPIDGRVVYAPEGHRLYKPRTAPTSDDSAQGDRALQLRMTRFLSSDRALRDEISLATLAAYMNQADQVLEECLTALGQDAKHDFVVRYELGPAAKTGIRLAMRPALPAPELEEIYDRLLAVPAPRVNANPLVFELLYTAWGGTGEPLDIAEPLRGLAEVQRYPEAVPQTDTQRLLQEVRRLETTHEHAAAIDALERARLSGPESDLAEAEILGALGQVFLDAGEPQKASASLERCIAVIEKRGAPPQSAERQILIRALQWLAEAYAREERSDATESTLQRLLAVYGGETGIEATALASARNTLALLHFRQHKYDDVESLLQKSLSEFEEVFGPSSPFVEGELGNLARFYEATGQEGRAIQAQWRANEIAERNLAVMLATGTEEQKNAYMARHLAQMRATVALHARYAPEEQEAIRLALTTLLRRKGRVLDAVANGLLGVRRRMDPSDERLFAELGRVRAQLAGSRSMQVRAPGFGEPEASRREDENIRLAQVEKREAELETALSARSAAFRTQTAPVTLDAVRKMIPEDAALVEIVWYESHGSPDGVAGRTGRYAAYVLRPDGEPRWVDLGVSDAIDRHVTYLQRRLADPTSRGWERVARGLYRRVVKPIRPLLGEATHLLVSSDGLLNFLPFGVLRDDHDSPLLERYRLTYLTSGRELLRLSEQAPLRGAPVIVAGPDFDAEDQPGDGGTSDVPTLGAAADKIVAAQNSPSQSAWRSAELGSMLWRPLHGAEAEGQIVHSALPGSRLLMRRAATERAIKLVQGPSILHMATHAYFLRDQPQRGYEDRAGTAGDKSWRENPLLRSGVVLAGANHSCEQHDGWDDGILTALELSGMDLWGTQLAVLSACDTGLGDLSNGEGVYGLRRALAIAGAETVVMSLWNVDDRATRDLMVGYYQRLLKGEGRSEALRQIQLALSHSSDRNHPFYWAGFVSSGDWRPLRLHLPGSS
jgi:CHAT domain-containing protein